MILIMSTILECYWFGRIRSIMVRYAPYIKIAFESLLTLHHDTASNLVIWVSTYGTHPGIGWNCIISIGTGRFRAYTELWTHLVWFQLNWAVQYRVELPRTGWQPLLQTFKTTNFSTQIILYVLDWIQLSSNVQCTLGSLLQNHLRT